MTTARLEDYLAQAWKTRFDEARTLDPHDLSLEDGRADAACRGLSAFDVPEGTARISVSMHGKPRPGILHRTPRPACARTRGPLQFRVSEEFCSCQEPRQVHLARGRARNESTWEARTVYYEQLARSVKRRQASNKDVTLHEFERRPGIAEHGHCEVLSLSYTVHLKSLLLGPALAEALAADDALRLDADCRCAGLRP
jgi:hypothetical protein